MLTSSSKNFGVETCIEFVRGELHFTSEFMHSVELNNYIIEIGEVHMKSETVLRSEDVEKVRNCARHSQLQYRLSSVIVLVHKDQFLEFS